MPNPYMRIARLKTAQDFEVYLRELGIELPFEPLMESGAESPLAQDYHLKLAA
jgi:hypothetical protein